MMKGCYCLCGLGAGDGTQVDTIGALGQLMELRLLLLVLFEAVNGPTKGWYCWWCLGRFELHRSLMLCLSDWRPTLIKGSLYMRVHGQLVYQMLRHPSGQRTMPTLSRLSPFA
jgi:hypothetical protein